MKWLKFFILACIGMPLSAHRPADSLSYRIETAGVVSNGKYAPLWLTANRYGMNTPNNKHAYLRAGVTWEKMMKRNWRIDLGMDLATGKNTASKAWIQQAYADISWKMLTLRLGSKEQPGFPLEKNEKLTSGWMVEGTNARPIPQIRGEIKNYMNIPGTRGWVAFKGHLCYGYLTDGNWQRDFVAPGNMYTQKVLYHSKSLMFRLGNREKFPAEFEFGLLMSAEFGGEKMKKNEDGSVSVVKNMPNTLKDFWNIFFPQHQSTLENVQGNHCGSWNFGLNYYIGNWKFRAYLEHYFEDHSQMFWQYGRWKDGHIGLEVTLPKNRWISHVIWEGLNTTDQTGPLLYDGIAGSFTDLQMSGCDNYYNNGEYMSWQNYGASLGHPFLLGPQYNEDRTNTIKSSRVKALHWGVDGSPSNEWCWRMLLSYTRNWGSYGQPFDEVKKQFCSLAEITYQPLKGHGWSISASLAIDRGNYPGNSTGGMLTIRKTGGLNF